MTSEDMTKVPCACGKEKEEIIGYVPDPKNDTVIPVRKGWYCVDCKAWETAILRETTVENL